MIQVKCKFTGARPFKKGLSGIVDFGKEADRHALIDLEGDAYLVKEIDINHSDSKEVVIREIRAQLEKIIKLLEDDKDTVEQETVLFEGE